jgi:hypothetical protein
MSNISNTDNFEVIVRREAARLIACRSDGQSVYVTTPLVFPSGAHVVVRVDPYSDSFFVSDFGAGYQEAEIAGIGVGFRRVARSVAERAGVRFDGNAIFELEINREQIAGAITAIANASQEAVLEATLKSAEKAKIDLNAVLHERIVKIYSPRFVARDVQVLGASNTAWHISTMVKIDGAMTGFEAVTKHHNSVVQAAVKFGDIARKDNPPARIAVVEHKESLGTLLGVLSQNAKVVEDSIPNSRLQKLVSEAA